jgi:hypothetical protein
MGLRMRHLLATLCVASLITLVVVGGSNPTGGFCLRTLADNRVVCKLIFTVPFYSICEA